MILLDTNALLWVHHDSTALGTQARAAIDAATRVHVSAVSILEITIKHMLGRLELPGRFPQTFTEGGLVELPFTSDHATALLTHAALARHDPFDRMLVAQALVEKLTFLTSDSTLLGLDEPWIRDARL